MVGEGSLDPFIWTSMGNISETLSKTQTKNNNKTSFINNIQFI